MAKLKLIADPTFTAKVAIPVAGGDPVDVEMTFKHRTRDEFMEHAKASAKYKDDTELVMSVAVGWGLDDAFNAANVKLLVQNHHGSAQAIASAYVNELTKARLGN